MHTQIQAPATRALRAGEKLATAMYAGEMSRWPLARLGPGAEGRGAIGGNPGHGL